MKMHDFNNGYDDAIKCLRRLNDIRRLNNTAEDSVIYTCYAYIYAASGEFSFTIDGCNSIITTNDTCVKIKNYIDDKVNDITVIDIDSVAAVHYIFARTKKR